MYTCTRMHVCIKQKYIDWLVFIFNILPYMSRYSVNKLDSAATSAVPDTAPEDGLFQLHRWEPLRPLQRHSWMCHVWLYHLHGGCRHPEPPWNGGERGFFLSAMAWLQQVSDRAPTAGSGRRWLPGAFRLHSPLRTTLSIPLHRLARELLLPSYGHNGLPLAAVFDAIHRHDHADCVSIPQ